MIMPRHINPRPRAIAPYNFVPLPNKVYSVAEGLEINGENIKPWEKHNQFVPGTHSGWIELKIKTLTPLFIRGPVTKGIDGEWDRREARLRPEPFTAPDGRPVIPGSSLRGMIRTLVEILSFSKIVPVTEERPFFRTVFSKSRIGKIYCNLMVRSEEKAQGGFLRRDGDGWAIEPCEVKQVERDTLKDINGIQFPSASDRDPSYIPPRDYQHKKCYIQVKGETDLVEANSICFQVEAPGEEWREAILVMTGDIPNKKHEFVFLVPPPDSDTISIPESIWERFHEETQLTQWQKEAFPRDKNDPIGKRRESDGYLREGDPIFFLCNETEKSEDNPDGLIFLGRALLFRLPYDNSPADLIPDLIKDAPLDLAQAMFGKVGQRRDVQEQTLKGRVFFEDAFATEGGPDWLEDIMVPRILSSPKITAYQHYLTQDGAKSENTYLESDKSKTTIRGHKLYWHRWDEVEGLEPVKHEDHENKLREMQSEDPKDTQCTIIRPVRSGVTFSGRIRFENLTDIELGALLTALKLPEGHAHKLGLGKPLGLGSMNIEPDLYIIDPKQRYDSWQYLGDLEHNDRKFIQAFEKEMMTHARETKETLIKKESGLRQIARLDALFLMLNWEGRLQDLESTRYMVIKNGDVARFGDENEYKLRLLLPTPHMVTEKKEPQWLEYSPTSNYLGQKPRPVLKGQTRNGVLKRSGDQWFALFEGDEREAVIDNPDEIPEEAQDGDKAEFYIIEQSKKTGIKARFDRFKR
jgi:CRISPR-associated protein (TIGR03986 family)